MQLGTASPQPNDCDLDQDHDEALAAPGFGVEEDATLDLLRGCVEAMGLLQAKFSGLEIETQIKLDAAAREIGDMRAGLASAKGVIDDGAARLGRIEAAIARLQVEGTEVGQSHADGLAAVRADTATWRVRAETDAARIEQLTARLGALEGGMSVRLDTAMHHLADSEAENTQLRVQADAAEGVAEQLQARLRDVDATIADQRARISSLQNKLAAANYAVRLEHMARNLDAVRAVEDGDILDLQTVGKALISAA